MAQALIDAGLGDQLLLPDSDAFKEREASYWSSTAQLKPAAIVRPRTAAEVATTVRALVAAQQPFAIRSGGHTQWAGSNNIAGGVTVDLSQLDTNATEFDAASETVWVGPGSRWRDVYAALQPHKRVVAGGREGNVGVAGLLLGGGNTFFTARRGFACDNIVAYEVVLADGRIVTADADHHADLFRALKGAGPANLGIVTRFRLNAIPNDQVWGGMTFFPRTVIPAAIDALHDFVDNVHKHDGSNLVVIFTHMPEFRDIVIATLYNQVDGIEREAAYKTWLTLPEITNTVKMTTIKDMAFEYNIPSGFETTWFTLSFKNDVRILTYASALHDKLVAELQAAIPAGDFVTQCLFQPLPTTFGQHGAAAGGNVMGVDAQKDNGVLFLAVAMVKTPELGALAYSKVKAWVEAVEAFASAIPGGNLPWRYLNYADGSQAVLESYGPENVRKIREAAAHYDPDGVFQKLVPGGFKISAVKE